MLEKHIINKGGKRATVQYRANSVQLQILLKTNKAHSENQNKPYL